jgi:ribosomal protein L27
MTKARSNATANAAKGDLTVGNGTNLSGVLGVGANGDTIVADSSTATGLRYQGSQAAGKNIIINGNFDIWQRGTTFNGTADGQYIADRWTALRVATTANLNVTRDTLVPNSNSEYSLKFQQVTTGSTSISEYAARQFIEQNNVLPVLGKSAVVSFWYRSNRTGSHGIRIYAGYNTGGGDQTTTFTVNAADTWEYKTVVTTAFSTVTAPSAGAVEKGAFLDIGFTVNGTGFSSLSANDYFQITQVQLELGTTATTFSRAGGTIQGELAACQRYYFRTQTGIGSGYFGVTVAGSSTTTYPNVIMKQTMRSSPTSIDFSGLRWQAINAAANITGAFISDATPENVILNCTTTGATTGVMNYFSGQSNTAFIGFSAEL